MYLKTIIKFNIKEKKIQIASELTKKTIQFMGGFCWAVVSFQSDLVLSFQRKWWFESRNAQQKEEKAKKKVEKKKTLTKIKIELRDAVKWFESIEFGRGVFVKFFFFLPLENEQQQHHHRQRQ